MHLPACVEDSRGLAETRGAPRLAGRGVFVKPRKGNRLGSRCACFGFSVCSTLLQVASQISIQPPTFSRTFEGRVQTPAHACVH